MSVHPPHKTNFKKLPHTYLNCVYYAYCFPTWVLFCGDASHIPITVVKLYYKMKNELVDLSPYLTNSNIYYLTSILWFHQKNIWRETYNINHKSRCSSLMKTYYKEQKPSLWIQLYKKILKHIYYMKLNCTKENWYLYKYELILCS